MASTTETRAPHVIEVPTLQRGRRLPEGWLRGIVGGIEAALLSWLTVVVPAVAAYVATAAAPALGDASWQAAAGTGTSLWLLAHGGTMTVGSGAVISVAPLGLAVLSLALVYGATRRMRLDSVAAGAFLVAGFVLAMAGFSFVATVPAGVGPALLGGALVAVAGAALALRRSAVPGPGWWSAVRDRMPAGAADGLHAAAWTLIGLGVVAAASVAVGLVAGWDRVLMVHDAYALDLVSTVVMVLGQVLFLPTAMVWALAWAAGPGFVVGAGTHFAPGAAATAPMPAIPILGALPSPDAPGPWWVVLAPVLVGLVVGVLLSRRRRQASLRAAVLAVVVGASAAAGVVALLVLAASGAIGPGRMAEVGADAPLVAALLLAEVGGAALLAVVALHARTHETLGGWAHAVWSRAREAVERRREARSAAAAEPGPTATEDLAERSGRSTSADTRDDVGPAPQPTTGPVAVTTLEPAVVAPTESVVVEPAGSAVRWASVNAGSDTVEVDQPRTARARPEIWDEPMPTAGTTTWAGPSLSTWATPGDGTPARARRR